MKASLPYKYIMSVKNGTQYVVFDFKDKNGKRKRKWVSTNLPEKSSKKALTAKVKEIVDEFDSSLFKGTFEPVSLRSPSKMKVSDYFSGLRWDAIDFTKKTITIQRKVVQVYDDDGVERLYVESRLKTNSTRRTLPLIPHIEKILLEKKKPDAHNKKYYQTFVCEPLLANDIPMKAIQEWLGHSTFNITANLYSHLEYNAKVTSAETIARVLGGDVVQNSDADSERKTTSRKKKEAPAEGETQIETSISMKYNVEKPIGRKRTQKTMIFGRKVGRKIEQFYIMFSTTHLEKYRKTEEK